MHLACSSHDDDQYLFLFSSKWLVEKFPRKQAAAISLFFQLREGAIKAAVVKCGGDEPQQRDKHWNAP